MHRVVFEITTEKVEAWHGVFNNIVNLRLALPAPWELEVVAHGKAIRALKEGGLGEEGQRGQALRREGVVIGACENSMKREGFSPADLYSFATPVDSGVAELVRKQEAGWSYIRSGG